MPNTAAPYGFIPVGTVGGAPFNGQIREYAMTTNTTVAIFKGDPVTIVLGQPIAGVASPTTTGGTSTPVGIMMGCRYVDVTTKKQVWSPYCPAGAVTAGHTDIFIQVADDPNMLMKIQGSGAVTAAAVGLNAPIDNWAAGSTTTGKSGVRLIYGSIATTATLALRIVEVIDPASSYPDVIVKWNAGVHAYNVALGQ